MNPWRRWAWRARIASLTRRQAHAVRMVRHGWAESPEAAFRLLDGGGAL